MPERAWGFNSPLAHHRRLTAIAPALQGGQQVTYGSDEKVTLRGGLFGCFRASTGGLDLTAGLPGGPTGRDGLITGTASPARAPRPRTLRTPASVRTREPGSGAAPGALPAHDGRAGDNDGVSSRGR